MEFTERIQKEVDKHNELVELRDQHQQAAALAEADRQVVQGRIEVLNELSKETTEETTEAVLAAPED